MHYASLWRQPPSDDKVIALMVRYQMLLNTPHEIFGKPFGAQDEWVANETDVARIVALLKEVGEESEE